MLAWWISVAPISRWNIKCFPHYIVKMLKENNARKNGHRGGFENLQISAFTRAMTYPSASALLSSSDKHISSQPRVVCLSLVILIELEISSTLKPKIENIFSRRSDIEWMKLAKKWKLWGSDMEMSIFLSRRKLIKKNLDATDVHSIQASLTFD